MENNLITIYLDPSAHENIRRDQHLFQTGTNKSKIIKQIIINYFEKYENDINELKQKIKDIIEVEIDSNNFDESSYLNISWKITQYLCENTVIKNESKKKDKIHIRKNKNDDKLDFILNSCPVNASMSEYLANIIYSYLKEPQYEREKIIYKKNINDINNAIKNNRSIKIKTKSYKGNNANGFIIQNIVPKEICTSREELYNYLLYQTYSEKKQKYFASTIHIYNILNVYIDKKSREFEPDIEKQFIKMKRNGVQFSINENTIYKIKLSDKGKKLFDSRYLERPVPLPNSDINQGIYYFDCSALQFKSYFAPFGEEVIFLEPKEIIQEIVKEYEDIINYYSNHSD